MKCCSTILLSFILCFSLPVHGTASGGAADSYPSKLTRIVVPFAPGGTSDILARLIGERLQKTWGRPVIVENQPGAAGNIAATSVAKAPADGYTVLLAAASIAVNPSLYAKLEYELFKNLVPVSIIAKVPFFLVVHPSLPITNVKEFVDYAKKHPGELNFGSGGSGTIPHLGGELLKLEMGIDMMHVPYRGGAPALADLMAGQIQLVIDGGPPVISVIDSGRGRALAVAAKERAPFKPDLPTLAESGLPDFESSAWQSIWVPGGTPDSVITKLSGEIGRIIRSPELATRLTQLGVIPVGSTPAEAERFIQAEVAKWAGIAKKSGAKVD